MTWFGKIDLAYKYTIVFASLLVLTILAGCAKVLYNRQKLKKHTAAAANVEAGPKEDQMELNQREKDEGDLFGIRAIEAGFYAGIPQSRPTSRASSFVDLPSRTGTLMGTQSFKDHGLSGNSSVTTLPLAHLNRDSDTSSIGPSRRQSPPTIRLAPSQAELNGRLNHNAAVNMNLTVPPSPVLARGAQSPTFSDSDSDGQTSPRSPRSPTFDHYAPRAPQIPMPHGLRPDVHSPEPTTTSQTASFNDPSPGQSPYYSAPSSPGPSTKLPSLPTKARREEPSSLFSASESGTYFASGPGQSNTEPERPVPSISLQPQTYQPTHQRDVSDASSVYDSENRASKHLSNGSAYNFSFPENSNRNSVALNTVKEEASSKEQSRRPSVSNSLLAPSSTTSNQTHETRLSEFYDAYYRHSQIGVASTEPTKRPNQLNFTHPTIVEVPSPLASPNPRMSTDQADIAWSR